MLVEASYVLLAGLVNRIRGGLFGDKIRKVIGFYGTTEGRLIYAVYLSSVYLYISPGLLYWAAAALTTVAIFLGHSIKGFAPWQSMTKKDHVWKMSLRGLAISIPIALSSYLVLSFGGATIIALGGALMGPIYYLSLLAPPVSWLNDVRETADNNDLAEVLFGLSTAASIVGGLYYG